MNTYAIADLHGRLDLLVHAITAIELDAGDVGGKLIVLGDFVDRGPESRGIVETLMQGPQRPGWEWIILQGNHEDIMLQALGDAGKLRWWIGNGGDATLQSYGYQHGDSLFPLKVPDDHITWLTGLPITYEDDRRIFVHAGVPFATDVAAASKQHLQWMLYPGDVDHGSADIFPDQPHISGKHIVHGHHQSAHHPLLKPHRTNLDSFACFTSRLAVGVFDDSQAAPVRIIEVTG